MADISLIYLRDGAHFKPALAY